MRQLAAGSALAEFLIKPELDSPPALTRLLSVAQPHPGDEVSRPQEEKPAP